MTTSSSIETVHVRAILKRQYHAALEMLRQVIERCPEELWYDQKPVNAFWQLAYHTLYYAHLYVQEDLQSFEPWVKEQSSVQFPDAIAGTAEPGSELQLIPDPYAKEVVLEYWQFCDAMIDAAIDAMDLTRRDSGFAWYPMSKLEHQLAAIRHIQHHTAQLADRLRASSGIGTVWVRGGIGPRYSD